MKYVALLTIPSHDEWMSRILAMLPEKPTLSHHELNPLLSSPTFRSRLWMACVGQVEDFEATEPQIVKHEDGPYNPHLTWAIGNWEDEAEPGLLDKTALLLGPDHPDECPTMRTVVVDRQDFTMRFLMNRSLLLNRSCVAGFLARVVDMTSLFGTPNDYVMRELQEELELPPIPVPEEFTFDFLAGEKEAEKAAEDYLISSVKCMQEIHGRAMLASEYWGV